MKWWNPLLVLCLTAMPAAAEVYKCKKPDGSLAYQETPVHARCDRAPGSTSRCLRHSRPAPIKATGTP